MMRAGKFREQLGRKAGFMVVTELAGGPNFDLSPITKFLTAYSKAGAGAIPNGFDFTAITLPQSPGGTANFEPAFVISKLRDEGLLDGLDCIPHLSCKDLNLNAIVGALAGFRNGGIESILALTGDKPVSTQGDVALKR